MTKKFTLVFLICVAFCISDALAQSSEMKFNEKDFNFGTFKEESGNQTHTFEFVNTGSAPVIIKQVKSSCGCTTPQWSKEPIGPGKVGFIKATYNPKNRPGPFNKSITVTSNSNPSVSVLRIRGSVTARVKTKKDLYPREMSGLRLKNNHLSFTKVKSSQKKETSLPIYNSTDANMTLKFNRVPSHISIKTVPAILKPKEEGKIVGIYDASLKKDWGFVIDYVDIVVNENTTSRNRLTVSANLVEDFASLSETELAKAPKVEFNETVYNFKELKQGESTSHIFKMKNTGKTDLIIRKTKASCGCTAINPASKIIKPGQETDLKVVFNSRGKRGRQNKLITVITNDPKQSEVKLRITGNVLLPKTN